MLGGEIAYKKFFLALSGKKKQKNREKQKNGKKEEKIKISIEQY